MDFPTRLDLFAIGRAYVLERAKKIDPTQVDVEGSDVNIFVGSSSVVTDYAIKQLAFQIAGLSLDGAEKEELDRYAFDRYQLTRKGASSALGQVRFFRTSASVGAGSIPANTKLVTNSGIEYVTTTTATFGGSQLEAVANVRAAQAGKATQVGANAIRRFDRPSDVFDPSIQMNNDLPTSGGEDAEGDELFRVRIRSFWRNARRGTLGAIEQGALAVAGVVSAQAIEALETDGDPARIVSAYIADSSGVANNQLATLVEDSLLEYRAAGIKVAIFTSLPRLVSVELKLTFRAGVDTVQLSESIRTAVVEFVNSLPVNGPLFVGQLFTVLERYKQDGLIVTQDSIVAPVGDLIPSAGETLRTLIDLVTVQ